MVSKAIDFEMFRTTLENKLLNTNKKIMQAQSLLM
jgi:hypothetical protein